MKLVTWNVNGIRACQKKGFLDFFEREKPEILCLQETKAHAEQLDEVLINPMDYDSYWTSASTRNGYSGTVTYTNLPVEKVDHGIGIKKFDDEGRFVVTQIHDILLYNVYFPNGAAREERHIFKQEFLKKFLRHLMKQIATGQKVIVVGDYNVAHLEIDVHDPVRLSTVSGFLPEEREWFSQFLDAGFTFVCPTEITQFRDALPKFKELGAEVIGCSIDSVHSHKRWIQDDLKDLGYPIIGDVTKRVSRDYGVLLEDEGIATRGTYIIDPEGTVQYMGIHNLSVGRDAGEIIRVLQGLQSGELCGAGWNPGDKHLTVN